MCVYIQVYHMHASYLKCPEEDIRPSGPGVTDGFEPPCGAGYRTWVLWKSS